MMKLKPASIWLSSSNSKYIFEMGVILNDIHFFVLIIFFPLGNHPDNYNLFSSVYDFILLNGYCMVAVNL